MPSSIDGQTLFDSGPERFVVKPVGSLFVPPLSINEVQTTTTIFGDLELWIVQTGRLVGDGRRRAVGPDRRDQGAGRGGADGDARLPNGRSFTGMSLLRFKPESAFDRGTSRERGVPGGLHPVGVEPLGLDETAGDREVPAALGEHRP